MANLSNINNKFLVTTGGNVLIGKTAVTGTSKLQVSGSLLIGTDISSGIPLVVQETTADGFAIGFMRNTNTTNGNGLVIDVNSTGGAYIQDWRQASTVKMRLLQNGNLGIGTDSPDSLLVVQANAHNEAFAGKRSATEYLWFLRNENNTGRFQLYNSSSNHTIEMTGANGRITAAQGIFGSSFALTSNGYATFGSTSSSVPIAFAIDGDGSSPEMFIKTDGKVGIGNTNPLAKLQITSGDSGASSPWSNADELVLESSGNAGLAFQTPNTGAATIAFQDPESVQAGFIQYLHGDNAMRFATNGNNIRMLINSSGNVGIGTDTPSALLEIQTVSTSGNKDFQIFSRGESPNYEVFKISRAAGSTELLANQNLTLSADYDANHTSVDSNIIFKTDNVEKMRIDSSGFVTIKNTPNTTGASLTLQNQTEISVNETIGYLNFSSTDTSTFSSGGVGGIGVYGEEAFNTSFTPTYMSFYTHERTNNDGTVRGNVTERMRITSEGTIEIRNGSTVGGEMKLTGTDNDFTINGKRGQVLYEIFGTQTYVMDSQQFYPSADNARNIGTGSNRFSVVYSANGVNTSDRTLKKNIKECDLGIDFINSLKPKSYNFKDLKEDNDAYGKKRYGLIAQDLLQTELKDAVFGEKDGEYGLSYNDLIAPMIKAIQELKAEIELLKSK